MVIESFPSTLTPRRWATPEQTATYAGLAKSTLAKWRCLRTYPLPYHRAGRAIRYDLNEVDAFLANSGPVVIAGGEG